MCGIAGWVAFDRDLTAEEAAARAMTATMACRGPDDEGLFLDPRVALGHRRLAVIDIEGGRQPMEAVEDGRRLAVLTYSGEVYNFAELRAELEGRGHRFRTRSDTEVVLRSYLEWGEGMVDRLNGMYAFAIWDARRQELLLVRDRLGVKPLYYYPLPDGLLFGSEPKAIMANPLVERVLDEAGLRELLSLLKTPEVTPFHGMYELRAGHLLRVRREGMAGRRYWSVEAREHTDDLDVTVATVRGLLEDIVTRQLVSDVPLCALLSGGLDSSTITALAARSLAGRGAAPIRSFAVDFAGSEENFEAGLADTPDRPFAHDLARHAGTDHAEVVLDNAQLMDPAVRTAVQLARDIPNGMGDFNTSLYLLFRAVREHSTVALSGEASDELFGGYPWSFHPAALSADTFPWMAFLQEEEAVGLPFSRAVIAGLDLPDYRAQRYRDAVAETPLLPGEGGTERRMREVNHVHLTHYLPQLLDRKDRMSMAVGLEVRVPFCDHRLVEYVFNVPWEMKTFDGHEKSLLRAAVHDLLPRSVLERRKAIFPTSLDPAYERAVRAELGRMLDRPDAPVLPLLDVEATRKLLGEAVPEVSTMRDRLSMEMALQLNAWMERYDMRLGVASRG